MGWVHFGSGAQAKPGAVQPPAEEKPKTPAYDGMQDYNGVRCGQCKWWRPMMASESRHAMLGRCNHSPDTTFRYDDGWCSYAEEQYPSQAMDGSKKGE